MRACVIMFVALLCVANRAEAHQTSVKYVDLVVTGEHTVDVTVRFAPNDVTDAIGLPVDAKPALATVVADPRVLPFVQQWFVLTGCTLGPARATPADASFAAVSYVATCATPRELALDFTRFFALDARHEAIVQLTAPGTDPIQTIVRARDPKLVLRAGSAPSLLAWVHTGMDHIYSGLDHILFVISLLLVVMLASGSARGEWQLHALVPTLRSTALVITAFTIAHSTTLIAAALGVVALPRAPVEAMIAVSIAYTAAEDVVNPAVRWRFVLTFGFGLVHGLGFAATLAELLPPRNVVIPLLCFNVGVEIGQLSIVLVVLPLLWLVARRVGAGRYRRYVLPALATPIFLVGLAMVVDRVS